LVALAAGMRAEMLGVLLESVRGHAQLVLRRVARDQPLDHEAHRSSQAPALLPETTARCVLRLPAQSEQPLPLAVRFRQRTLRGKKGTDSTRDRIRHTGGFYCPAKEDEPWSRASVRCAAAASFGSTKSRAACRSS